MTAAQPSTEEWITTSPTVLDGKPRVKNTRIGVHFLATQIVEDESDPDTVASQYGIPSEAVQAAVDYYYNHPEKMAAIDRRRAALFEDAEQNSTIPTTPEELADLASGARSTSD